MIGKPASTSTDRRKQRIGSGRERAEDNAAEPSSSAAYRDVVDELALLLRRRDKHELRVRIGRLFAEKFEKLVVVVFEKPPTPASEMTMSLKPSDLLTRLLVAVRADDHNALSIIEHELRS
jgi:hypothetical protein